VTIFVFGIGIFVGILIENSRLNNVNELYEISGLNLLDLKLIDSIYSEDYFNCEFAEQENIALADKIYEEARLLEDYQEASRLTSDKIDIEHKKYDILRAMLFVNSLKIKSKCNSSYINVIYFYDYNDPSLEIKSRQEVISRLLGDLKSELGNKILLIPIAGDNDIISIKILMNQYNISESELPVILINEKYRINDVQNLESLLEYFD
jgi:hypothetical protein